MKRGTLLPRFIPVYGLRRTGRGVLLYLRCGRRLNSRSRGFVELDQMVSADINGSVCRLFLPDALNDFVKNIRHCCSKVMISVTMYSFPLNFQEKN